MKLNNSSTPLIAPKMGKSPSLNSMRFLRKLLLATLNDVIQLTINRMDWDIQPIVQINWVKIKQIFMQDNSGTFSLVVHGGSGTIMKEHMTAQLEEAHKNKLLEALSAGEKILKDKGTALDAVQAAVRVLEDSQMFNAGKGAVFSSKGINEMDASIMDGKTRKAGSIAGSTKIKNPISAARKVMQKSQHVMLSGEGANQFAIEQGLQIVDPSYFYSELRYKQLQMAKEQEKCLLDHNAPPGNKSFFAVEFNPSPLVKQEKKEKGEEKFGTVGAVALDTHGNLAAGTSTGGMTNKKYGRIGDSPIIGAGSYANNKTCAVSSTGQGEYFIRGVIAYDVSAIMQFTKAKLEEAANKVIHQRLEELGGNGGIIAVDSNGNIAMPFNTSGMYRGFVRNTGEKVVMIYKDQ